MIKVSNLSFKIKDKQILKDISFAIKDGERIAIVGGNGAGKTTLVESMLQLNKSYTGEVKYDFDYKKSPLEKVGVQFQDSIFPAGLTVRDIIEYFSKKGKDVDVEFQNELIKTMGIDQYIDVDSSKISGGQAQKLNVLLALIAKPKLLFMDELTTGLDVCSRSTITNEVEKYLRKNKATLLLVTHTAGEIERFIDRVLVLEKGKLVNDLSVKEIVKEHKSVEEFLLSLK
ncbi:MAG: ABC transporter ATP-binding protein [Mycoplasmataceae bacterium]|nr:ABC transporter ATP-binding protein [Mycoplasmataceae bacterium]